MKKVLIVSHTCPKCYSLLNTIYKENLYTKFIDNNLEIIYYNKYADVNTVLMEKATKYLEELDPERYAGIPHVTPVLLEYSQSPQDASVIVIGENGISAYLRSL